jgi:hypothetical protein
MLVNNGSAADNVTAASYGGVALNKTVRAVDAAGEPGNAEIWYLGAGASIPQGTQTVSYTCGTTTNDYHVVCVTLLGARPMYLLDYNTTQGDQANPAIGFLNPNGYDAIYFGCIFSGQNAPTSVTLDASLTSLSTYDFGTQSALFVRTSASTATTYTMAFTSTTEDVALAGMAFHDNIVPPATTEFCVITELPSLQMNTSVESTETTYAKTYYNANLNGSATTEITFPSGMQDGDKWFAMGVYNGVDTAQTITDPAGSLLNALVIGDDAAQCYIFQVSGTYSTTKYPSGKLTLSLNGGFAQITAQLIRVLSSWNLRVPGLAKSGTASIAGVFTISSDTSFNAYGSAGDKYFTIAMALNSSTLTSIPDSFISFVGDNIVKSASATLEASSTSIQFTTTSETQYVALDVLLDAPAGSTYNPSETLFLTDSMTVVRDYGLNLQDTIALSDGFSKDQGYQIFETITLSDIAPKDQSAFFNDPISVIEIAPTLDKSIQLALTDSISLIEVVPKDFSCIKTDPIGVFETLVSDFSFNLSDSLTINDASQTRDVGIQKPITETISLSEVFTISLSVEKSEVVSISEPYFSTPIEGPGSVLVFYGVKPGTLTWAEVDGNLNYINNKKVGIELDTSGSLNVQPTLPTNNCNLYNLSGNATFQKPVGTPSDGHRILYKIKDDGAQRNLTWDQTAGGFRPIGCVLPSVTQASKTLYVGVIYNAADSYWDVVAVIQQ